MGAARRLWDAAKHPRVPAGRREGGRFADHPAAMSDARLAQHFSNLSRADRIDEPRLRAVAAEMDRRDIRARARSDAVDHLIGQGVPHVEAYAQVHGLDPTRLYRQQQTSLINAARQAGETREQTIRRLYAEHVHQQHLAAETATRGHLLTADARAAGVDPISLFSGSHSRAQRHASEDLLRWWSDHPRSTYAQFRAELLGTSSQRRTARYMAGSVQYR